MASAAAVKKKGKKLEKEGEEGVLIDEGAGPGSQALATALSLFEPSCRQKRGRSEAKSYNFEVIPGLAGRVHAEGSPSGAALLRHSTFGL